MKTSRCAEFLFRFLYFFQLVTSTDGSDGEERLRHWMNSVETMVKSEYAVKSLLEWQNNLDEKSVFCTESKLCMMIHRQKFGERQNPERVALFNSEYFAEIAKINGFWMMEKCVLKSDTGFLTQRDQLEGGNYFDSFGRLREIRRAIEMNECKIEEVPVDKPTKHDFLGVSVVIDDRTQKTDGLARIKKCTFWFVKAGGLWPERVFVENVDGSKSTFFYHPLNTGNCEFPFSLTVIPDEFRAPYHKAIKGEVKYYFEQVPFESKVFGLSYFGLPEPANSNQVTAFGKLIRMAVAVAVVCSILALFFWQKKGR